MVLLSVNAAPIERVPVNGQIAPLAIRQFEKGQKPSRASHPVKVRKATADDPISVTGSNLVLYDETAADETPYWQVSGGTDEGYNVGLVCYSTSIAGQFSTADFDDYYSYVSYNNDFYDVIGADLTVTYADNTATITGKFVGLGETSGAEIEFAFNLQAVLFVPQVYDITIHSFTYTAGGRNSNRYATYKLTSEDGKYIFTFTFTTGSNTDITNGQTYTEANLRTSSTSRGEDYNRMQYVNYSTLTFVKDLNGDGKITITVVVVDNEGNTWNLSYVERELAPTELHLQYDNSSTPFNEAFELYEIGTGSTAGTISLSASNENNGYISLEIFASELTPGVYEINSTKEANTILASVGVVNNSIKPSFAGFRNANGQFSTSNLWFLQVGTLTVAEDGSAVLNAQNSYGISVNATFGAPLPPHIEYDTYADFNENFGEYDVTKEDGYFEIEAQNSNNAYLYIRIFSTADALAAGEYPVNDSQAENTVLASIGVSGGYIQPSFVGYLGSNGLTDFWYLVDGTVTIAEDGSIVIAALNSYGKEINCSLEAPLPPHLDYDTNADFAHDFDGYELDDSYFDDYGELDIMVLSDDYQLIIALYSATKELTAGEYPINNTGMSGTVMASEGYVSGVGAYPSYVATVSEGYFDELWYFVSGTVTVKSNLAIEVAAVNSFGKSIAIKLGAPVTTAISNTEAPVNAGKRIQNGMLIIEKNGVKYNALGVEVK